MIRSFAGRYALITFKILLILLMLNLSTVYLSGQTIAAVDSFAGGNAPESGGETVSDDIDSANVSAGIDLAPASTSKPVDAKVIVLPKGGAAPDDSKKDDKADSEGGRSTYQDEVQGEGDNPHGSVAAGADKDSLSQDQNSENQANLQQGQAGQSKQDTVENASATPASGQASDVNASITLIQADLDKVYRHEGEKVAYLTFDDGPFPSLTSVILDILKEEDVKATFFMIGSNAERYPEMVRRQYEEGHGIGNHTYSHVFKQIYASPENYIVDLAHSEQVLKSILGEDKEFKLTRFPGGSFSKALAPYRQAVNEAGYVYVDWNSLNGDAETNKVLPAKRLVERLKETVTGQSGLIVLMHDAPNKHTTVEALPEIIQFLKSENYRFELLPGSR